MNFPSRISYIFLPDGKYLSVTLYNFHPHAAQIRMQTGPTKAPAGAFAARLGMLSKQTACMRSLQKRIAKNTKTGKIRMYLSRRTDRLRLKK